MDSTTNLIVTIALSVFLGFLYSFCQKISLKRIVSLYNNGEYDVALNRAIKKKANFDATKRIFNFLWNNHYNNLCFIIATISFFRGDYDCFLLHIDEIRGEENQSVKRFWMDIYYIFTSETVQLDVICDNNYTQLLLKDANQLVINGLAALKRGLTDEARRCFECWMNNKQPKNPILCSIITEKLKDISESDKH